MVTDAKHIAAAYRILGLQPGVSPLAARRRYRDLIKESHPDRFPTGSPLQAEATRITQEINDAYRTIKQAAIHHEVPLRRPTPAAQSVSSSVAHFEDFTVTDRVLAAVVGVLLGGFLDLAIMSESALVWLAVPLIAGAVGALFGWRAIEMVIRVLWWIIPVPKS
jgi:preprotein translocase subunit Sec63